MNKLSLLFLLSFFSSMAFGQIRYLPTYSEPYQRPQQQQQPTQSMSNEQSSYFPSYNGSYQYQQPQQVQEEIKSAIAYYKTNDGYVKLPIRVTVNSNGTMKVNQVYIQNLTGGEWRKISNPSPVQKCRSYSYDKTENLFMYKCSITFPEVTTIYFDL